MPYTIIQEIADKNNLNLIESKQLSGGDINQVFKLKCSEGDVVVKINDALKYPEMFSAEAKGLKLLKTSDSFKIPEIIDNGRIENVSYLLLEYISSGRSNSNFWEVFGENLASLHKTTQKEFGLTHDNYIGSLPQKNNSCVLASEFYISQRLEPQFKIASENGFQFKNLHIFFKNISNAIPKESPSLIHGDLWSGNYIISENGEAVLIDPAVAFAPREMDLAMMMLFGGFPNEVFDVYNSIFKIESGWRERISLWQLYYLLVHLNLFGMGYLGKVKSIVSKYS